MAQTINDLLDIRFNKIKELNIPITLGPYTFSKVIFETVNSVVLLSHDPNTRRKLAIKCVPIDQFNLNPVQVQTINSVNDPHIIKVLDSFQYPQNNPRFFVIVMPLAYSDLLEYLNLNGSLPESIVCKIMRESLKALNVLHSNNIWHRDLKLENILITKEGKEGPSIEITGFTSSIVVNTPTITGQGFGTLQYAAPELLVTNGGKVEFSHTATYSENIDVYSMGVNMYALFCGSLPFQRMNAIDVNFNPDDLGDHVSQEAKNLINLMLEVNPANRISAEQALNHPWFQNFPNTANQDDDDDDLDSILSKLDAQT